MIINNVSLNAGTPHFGDSEWEDLALDSLFLEDIPITAEEEAELSPAEMGLIQPSTADNVLDSPDSGSCDMDIEWDKESYYDDEDADWLYELIDECNGWKDW